jgi:GH15 family glucan-1,4-alpha-glucosidase
MSPDRPSKSKAGAAKAGAAKAGAAKAGSAAKGSRAARSTPKADGRPAKPAGGGRADSVAKGKSGADGRATKRTATGKGNSAAKGRAAVQRGAQRRRIAAVRRTGSTSALESAERALPQSAAMPSPFPPIADYAFLSDCHTGALVAPDGSIDWLCVPRFDAPSVFGTLLDRQGGSFRLGPFGINVPSGRVYEPGTNILLTTWRTPTGWVMVRDALTFGARTHEDLVTPHTRPPTDEDADHVLVRTALCLEGEVEMEITCEPVFDYGRVPAQWSVSHNGHRADATGADVTIRLQTNLAVGVEGDWVRGRHVLRAGELMYCSLSWAEELAGPETVDQANERLSATTRFWREWLGRARIPDHRWRDAIQRSALAIKGLTFMPTGATVAALTTSLPETPGGARNWDYRFTWLRDSTFTLQALHYLNLDWEAEEFMQFIGDLEPNSDGALQIMYGIDGRRDLTETTRDDLSGYAGASPVRVGNGAYNQRQNDVYGAALDSILLHTRRSQRLPRRLWPIVQAQAECASKVWRQPDQGIWEARGKPRHYVSSKLMCWVAMDRASKLAAIAGEPKLETSAQASADRIKEDILAHGLRRDGALRQHYETDALDASTLLAPLFGFLPAEDPVMHASVMAIADELTENGYVLRYRTDETEDGMSGREGSFLICSFWLVSGLSIVGEEQRARDLMERLLRIASPLGLYAEEYDPDTARMLGNFPQAFSHLALIEAAGRIILAELTGELS